ncbi:MAG: hypothetical protein ABI317_04115, partial [Gaiellales bacterium]
MTVESELAERAPRGLVGACGGIVEALARPLDAGVPAGATLLVVDADGVLLRVFGGSAVVIPEPIPTTRDTIYDVASLTKVVV